MLMNVEKTLPFHVSGEFARLVFEILDVPPHAVWKKFAAAAGGKYNKAQVRIRITEPETKVVFALAENLLEDLDVSNPSYRLTKTVHKNAKRALEMFEEQREPPFVPKPWDSDEEREAFYKSQNYLIAVI